MSIEAMKQALEALEELRLYPEMPEYFKRSKAITSLRQAIAEAEKQEQLREENERLHVENRRLIDRIETIGVPVGVGGFVTTTTSQSQRQPLTDEQINAFFQGMEPNNGFWLSFARAIEAAHGIKEKNT